MLDLRLLLSVFFLTSKANVREWPCWKVNTWNYLNSFNRHLCNLIYLGVSIEDRSSLILSFAFRSQAIIKVWLSSFLVIKLSYSFYIALKVYCGTTFIEKFILVLEALSINLLWGTTLSCVVLIDIIVLRGIGTYFILLTQQGRLLDVRLLFGLNWGIDWHMLNSLYCHLVKLILRHIETETLSTLIVRTRTTFRALNIHNRFWAFL